MAKGRLVHKTWLTKADLLSRNLDLKVDRFRALAEIIPKAKNHFVSENPKNETEIEKIEFLMMTSFYEKLLEISNFASSRKRRQNKKNRRDEILRESENEFSFGFDPKARKGK